MTPKEARLRITPRDVLKGVFWLAASGRPARTSWGTLEDQLHRHLKLARRRCPVRPRQRRGRNTERTWRPSTIAGLVELRVIEDVKQLKAGLQFDAFRDAGPLGQCHVEIRISRSVELIASEIAGRVVVRIRESAVAGASKRLGGDTGIKR